MTMRTLGAICAFCNLLALTACATDQQGVRVVLQPTPVPVACVDASQVPAEPPQVGDQLNGDARHDLGIVAPSALELRAYARTLRALIEPGCETISGAHD
jgi:hypothetical protein